MSVEDLIVKSKPNLSIKSLKSYVGNINKVFKHMEDDKLSCLNDIEKVVDYIDTKNSYLTKRNYLNSIIVSLQSDKDTYNKLIDEYVKIRDDYNERYKIEQATNQKSEKQTKNWINLKQIYQIIQHLEQDLNNEQNLIWWFMINFWINYPIRNDLQYTEIITKRKYDSLLNKEIEKRNFFVIDNRPFVSISQYKTCKKYGVKKIEMNDKMNKILLKYISKNLS